MFGIHWNTNIICLKDIIILFILNYSQIIPTYSQIILKE